MSRDGELVAAAPIAEEGGTSGAQTAQVTSAGKTLVTATFTFEGEAS